jgi:hypothetical protein
MFNRFPSISWPQAGKSGSWGDFHLSRSLPG